MLVRRRLELADRAANPIVEIPFEVPVGTESLEVCLTVGDASARIDLGCRSPRAWRGWSGGARRRFVIARDEATWGYLPGELEPGTWAVVLGLHEVPLIGVDVELEITLPGGAVEADPPPPNYVRRHHPVRPTLPAPAGRTWFAVDLHAHSVHSDGLLPLASLVDAALRAGLDAIAITDHNTTSHHRHLPALAAASGLVVIPGQEVTTGRGHVNVWGDVGWIDFREHPDQWLRTARERGGVASINHPVSGDCAWQWSVTEPIIHAELFHSSWLAAPESAAPWAWWSASRATIPVAGGDYHHDGSGRLGQPVTWIASREHSVEGLIDALRGGFTAVAASPTGPCLLGVDGRLIAVEAEGLVFSNADGDRRIVASQMATMERPGRPPWRLETDRRTIVAAAMRA